MNSNKGVKPSFKKPVVLGCALLLGLILANPSAADEDDDFKHVVEREWQDDYAYSAADLAGTKLVVDINIGGIEVMGHAGSDIEISITTRWRGMTEQDLQQAEEELEMLVEETSYGLLVYLDTPYRNRGERYQNLSRNYRFKNDIILKVPHNFELDLHSVTRGDLSVNAMTGKMKLKTVTGDIVLDQPQASTVAETISGDIRIGFLDEPNLDIELESRFGKLYSEFSYNRLPGSDDLLVEKVGGLTSYRRKSFSNLRFGAGGVSLKLKTLSGDIVIEEI